MVSLLFGKIAQGIELSTSRGPSMTSSDMDTENNDVVKATPPKVSRLTLLALSFAVFISFLMIPAATKGATNDYFFYGGLLGMFSSAVVIYRMLLKESSSSRTLLMYRAVCDFGIGLRFVLNPVFMQSVCESNSCSIEGDDDTTLGVDTDFEDKDACGYAAGMLQFFEMASEAWFLCLAYDLAVTITNPFSSPSGRVWSYHAFCWTIASIFTIIIVRIDNMAGYWYVQKEVDSVGICWVRQKESDGLNLNPKTFIFLYIPLCIVYVYAVRVIWGAYGNLKKGISKTFQHRVKVLLLNSINIGIYILYWFVLLVFYVCTYFLSTTHRDVAAVVWKLLWFFLSSKGFADLLVFIFVSDGYAVKSEDESAAVDFNTALRQEVLHYATTGIRECASRRTSQKSKNKLVLIMNQKNTPLKSIFNFRALAKIVFSGGNITPQHPENQGEESLHAMETETTEIEEEGGRPTGRMSKRLSGRSTLSGLSMHRSDYDVESQDVVDRPSSNSSKGHKSTRSSSAGSDIEKSIRMGSFTNSNEAGHVVSGNASFDCNVDDEVEEHVTAWEQFKAVVEAPLNFYSKFSLNRFSDVSVEFVEFEPYYFRKIRLNDNVADDAYIMSFMKTIKERLTEGGASGAFFFFTKDERFIAKSCTTDEVAHIRRSAVVMAKYLEENPYSFITKIYGAYKLQIYGTSFYFFVTNNIFLNPDNEVINEKYDLKGSWVKRNSTPPQIGQRATCTHCNQKFVFTNSKRKEKKKKGKKKGAKDEADDEEQNKCRMQVLGHHEPNVILKDNDLKYKLRLPNKTSHHLITQLHKDSEFLCSLGVMDYSLLVGVHNTEYHVDEEKDTGSMSEPDSPKSSGKKPQRRRTLSSKNSGAFMSNSGSKEDLSSLSSVPAPHPLNGRMAVSRIVGPEAYYMGIVDFQQQYDFSKKLERFFKVQIQGKSGAGLSCIEPVAYRQRFLRRMEELVDYDIDELDLSSKSDNAPIREADEEA